MQDSWWMQTARFFIIVVPILMLLTHAAAHLLERLRAPANFPDVDREEIPLAPELEREFLTGAAAQDPKADLKAFLDGRLTVEEFFEIRRRRMSSRRTG